MAIDGKTLRGSFDAFHDRKAAHVLSAFAADGQIILGHLAISEKSNEIPAAHGLALAKRVKMGLSEWTVIYFDEAKAPGTGRGEDRATFEYEIR